MNRKQFLINEIANLVLSRLDEESKIGDRIKHAFSYAKSRILSKDFDFASIVQDLKRNRSLAKLLINLIDQKQYDSAHRIAIRLYEVITEAFNEIGFVPGRVEPVRGKYMTHDYLSYLSISLSTVLSSFIAMVEGPRNFSPSNIEADADYIVSSLSNIIAILETFK